VALKQLAAAQLLPNLNFGASANNHQGVLQQSNGNILNLDRNSMYVGLGAFAVGSGTVTIPGIYWNGNVADVYFARLVSQQVVRQRGFESDAVRNDVLLRVAAAYLELLRNHGRRALAVQIRDDGAEVARVTANFARTGQGRQADADRAETELRQRDAELAQIDGDILVASARLCQLLHLDPSLPLQPNESQVVPSSLVPDVIPLPELLAIALTQRPELRARQAAIQAALLDLHRAKALPFAPNMLLGYSAGGFGGGSNLIGSNFSGVQDRQDADVVLYWTVRNLGFGNVAQIRLARSQVRQNELTEMIVLDRVRAEVATAQARLKARSIQIDIAEKAVRSSRQAFQQDLTRTRNTQGREGLPIEVLDSLRLLARSRYAYLDAIIDYNRAHFELYVAMGQPPADLLARPVPPQATAPLPSSLPGGK
jgi:outer membrane protein TolC